MKDRCLTDEEMSVYVDGVVDSDLRRRIEEHLSDCAVCLHHVAELKELVSPKVAQAAVPTPEALSKAEDIISQFARPAPGFDITVALRQGLCKVLETTGELLTPRGLAPVAVRGDGRTALTPRIAKSIAGYLVTVELPARKGRLRPKVMVVQEASSQRPDGIKIKLYSPGACETKYTESGKAAFQPVGSGDYTIDIEDIGTVELEVTP
jgi:anti-sigma factor RsiW